jgi:hypothetical protein
MSKNKKYEVVGKGELCPKCDNQMQRREHKNILDKQKNAPYYFKAWDYCIHCNHLQHYENLKVFNNNKSASLYKQGAERAQQFQDFKRLIS